MASTLGMWMASAEEGGADAPASVLVTRIDGPITPIMADHIGDAVATAERAGYDALVVEVNTPGGLSESMRRIVEDFLVAEVPIVAYVSPRGGQAASAGALISWSAHVVAMAPSTTIGAATPVQLEGGEVGDKIVENAAAFARTIAEAHGRDVEVIAASVTEGRALSDSEALDAGVAEFTAVSRTDLLEQLDGYSVTLADGTEVTLDTQHVTVDEHDMTLLRSILQFLADPNLAFILLSLGTLGIIYELANPGVGAAGGVGAVLIILALVALAILPIDAAGLLLLVLAAALFVAEVFAPGIGIAAALGSVALVLSAIFTFRDDAPGMRVSLAAVVPTAVVVGLAVVIAGRVALRARSAESTTGLVDLIGREVVVGEADGTTAQVYVRGSWWTVHSHEPLEDGMTVRVTGIDGIWLEVEPLINKRGGHRT